jgi:hypothetical protein
MLIGAISEAWWQRPDWVSAIATVAAVVAALLIFLVDRLLLSRARLRIDAVSEPPDWSSGFIANPNAPDGHEAVFVVRLRVKNSGPDAGRNVEAVVHGIERKQDGQWTRVVAFLPSSLRWTHIASGQLPLLVPRTMRHIDLGEIRRTTYMGADAIFLFALVPRPVLAYHLLHPGEYRVSITVAAENARPCTAVFEIVITGDWDAEDTVMAKKGLRLRRIK